MLSRQQWFDCKYTEGCASRYVVSTDAPFLPLFNCSSGDRGYEQHVDEAGGDGARRLRRGELLQL